MKPFELGQTDDGKPRTSHAAVSNGSAVSPEPELETPVKMMGSPLFLMVTSRRIRSSSAMDEAALMLISLKLHAFASGPPPTVIVVEEEPV